MKGLPQEVPQLDKADAREILDLKAREVSIVDRPAIERTFLVVKRKQEDEMGAFATDDGGAATHGTDELIEKMAWRQLDESEIEKALPEDLRKSIGEVSKWLKTAAKAEGAPADAIKQVAAFLSKVAAGKFPMAPGKTDDTEKGNGEGEGKGDGDAANKGSENANKAACPKCGAEMVDGVCKACGYKETKAATSKSASEPEGISVKITPEGGVEISGQPVTKAGVKGFTSERAATFGAAVKSLMGMMADLDPEVAKGIISELVGKALPGELKFTSSTPALDAKAVKKAVEDAVAEALAPVTAENTELKKRLETIEKSRTDPQSTEGDGTTTTDDVNKGKSFWAGVPLR
jgi:hypothetical protein